MFQSEDDPILAPLLHDAAGDPETLGLILGGSRGAGTEDEESDFDILWILKDEACERCRERGEFD